MSAIRALLIAPALAVSLPAAACKIVPDPTTADLVSRADAIQVVDVLRIETDPDVANPAAGDGRAIATIRIVESLKGDLAAKEMRLATVPDDCGGWLWPGRWLVYLQAPSKGSPHWNPGYGSFPLWAADAESGAEYEKIKSLLSGNNK